MLESDPNVEGSPYVEDVTVDTVTIGIEAYARRHAADLPPVRIERGRQLPILGDLDRFKATLQAINQHFTVSSSANSVTAYAQEWLLDNYYIVQRSLLQLGDSLPRRYYYRLPKLSAGPYAGYPRIYALARAFATYTEGQVEQQSAAAFLTSFQERIPLTTGELWAWPIMLRLCALENLVWSLEQVSDLEDFSALLDEGLRAQLRHDHPEPQLLVARSISGLRLLNTQDWPKFFESVSRVEALLRRDPAGVYRLMDFETRDQYRGVVEKLAVRTALGEEQIAQAALQLARSAPQDGQAATASDAFSRPREAHVGYYLVDAGYPQLLHALQRDTWVDRLRQGFRGRALTASYIGAILVVSLALALAGAAYASAAGGTSGQILTALLVILIPASAAAVNVINWLILQRIKPARLPKLDFSEGIPSAFRSVVVIPALLSDQDEVDTLAAQLELHYLRNTDANLRFAVLADYPDAAQQHLDTDEALLEQAKAVVDDLNQRYGAGDYQPFYFFLRERRWNPAENTWMGYERKRGKLAEFNRLLLEPHAETTYSVKHGDLAGLVGTRYVITLDTDTVLPQTAARRLVGTLAHPLNQPVFSADGQRVIAGYTVLQPRVELLPTVKNRSLFAQVMGGDAGFDLYTLAVSDIYQDLFGEGVYVGKGIYDVAAFERSTAGRIPENALLSHDLFEGIQGRAGLVTDIVLIEDYPTHYLAFTRRLHRWIRGDWQLVPWLLPLVPAQAGKRVPNRLSALSYWKVFDNLRRSLERPALLLLFIAGWLLLPGSPYVWSVIALLVMWIPFMLGVFVLARSATTGKQLTSVRETRLLVLIKRWGTSLMFLPYETALILDAILRTLYRLTRGRRLLQWTTAASAMREIGQQPRFGMWQHMLSGTLITLAVGAAILLLNPAAFLPALPLLVIWMLAPIFAERLSQPYLPPRAEQVSAGDTDQLRKLARRTWLFFEAVVGPGDHWLPPDHLQREPDERVKHYTSPTNIGLMLLSTLGARDMGYIGLLDLMLRLRYAFDSIGQLERYRGHLLNWYNTQSLDTLTPRYVSTVDSGNYAGCLVALKEGYASLRAAPALNPQRWQGLIDLLDIVAETLDRIEAEEHADAVRAVREALNPLRQHSLVLMAEPARWAAGLSALMETAWPALEASVERLATVAQAAHPRATADLNIFLSRVHHHAFSMQRDIESLLPWQILHQSVPAAVQDDSAACDVLQRIQDDIPTLGALPDVYAGLRATLEPLSDRLPLDAAEARAWCDEYRQALDASAALVADLIENFDTLWRQITQELNAMDFSFLYDEERELFRIGYNVENEQPDANHYDLLASEARLASYIAIAKGDAPHKHWLHLGRPMTLLDRGQVLHSWSGTMFEYLMPMLLMRHEADTLLSSSAAAATAAQIAYAKQQGTPWGISESGFYAFDLDQNYQYRAFGVPHLALKRGQDLDHVIAPYASLLALPIQPAAVLENLRAFDRLEALDTYGLIEAIDFTSARLPVGQDYGLVNEYMAHHQGMIFLTLVNFLRQDVMVRHFHANPRVKSVELLLLEQIPPEINQAEQAADDAKAEAQPVSLSLSPWDAPVDTPLPSAHYLSNGRYGVMITSAGGGFSQWKHRALTRWRADTTLDDWGTWLYLRDEQTGRLWSAAYQPVDGTPERLKATFAPHKAEFVRRDYDITSRLEIVVPPDDDLEIRRLTLTNHSAEVRRLTVCSYGEMVLAPQASDQRHQAFNKLFIESEFVPDLQALVFKRRPRSAHDEALYVLHRLITPDGSAPVTVETDRERFLGRNGTIQAPHALTDHSAGLSGTTGATLDPVMALAHTLEIQPYQTVKLVYLTAAGDQWSAVVNPARAYGSWAHIEHAVDQARYHTERDMHQMTLDTAALQRIQRLFSALMYPHPLLRAQPGTLARNTLAQSGLWAFGISGEHPIVLVEISAEDTLGIVRELVQAHTLWRNQGIKTTLVILNLHDTGYDQALYNQLHSLIARMHSELWLNRHDGIFILRNEQLIEANRVQLRAAARIVLKGRDGSLAEQLALHDTRSIPLPAFVPTLAPSGNDSPGEVQRPADLVFDNGRGGFTPDGHEYVITVAPGQPTPAPWTNVIANENAGFTITESGGGYSWAYNSGENRLTHWRNDPVTDMPAEAVYLRDEETGAVWSPTPLPAPSGKPYLVRHGAGYTQFEHHSHGVEQTVRYYGAPQDPVKFVRIRLKNASTRARRITVTYYAEWVLGPTRDITQQYLIPSYEAERHTLLVRNPYSIEFGSYHAFITADRPFHGLTTDRAEFLGRMGNYQSPQALKRIGLSGATAAGTDPCAAVQVHVSLPVDGEEEVCFILGQGIDRDSALALSQQHRDRAAIESAWTTTRDAWRARLDSIIVRTPDQAMNLILPWLLYQALACRIWGRSALYQSSGAYGFRDQLQDVMALIHVDPALTRDHLLRAARHQFDAGDVLHWWHPPSGRGVRTRFADDLLWLPFVVAHYVRTTGDVSVLHERVPFLKGEPLRPDEEERYGFYETSDETGTLYEHCRRALERGFTQGINGLPLMQAGDWNDGMNRVGIEGRGESVWMAWFLYMTMDRFLPLCEALDDTASAALYRTRMADLQATAERNAWDGAWYRRAYYDDGTPLGSAQNSECKIDSLGQSWAVLSGGADSKRAQQAMQSVDAWLVDEAHQLLKLFTPPFNHTIHDPGYIKGYPPGIRENGGQYTHAALWVVWAFAEMGQGQRAGELFRLLNPILHADTPAKADLYRVEPYVIAADVYSEAPHTGRGGWTWYTGSSGWMYRLGIEALLGLGREGSSLRITPRIPHSWPYFEVDYRYGQTTYHIRVDNPNRSESQVAAVTLDGRLLPAGVVPLEDDGGIHSVQVTMA